jgi:hypothetical protein
MPLQVPVNTPSGLTSDRSTRGGPSAISSAFVPGRILLSATWSRLLNSCCCSAEADIGDSWSSGIGGGLGRRGEAGEVMSVVERANRSRSSFAPDVCQSNGRAVGRYAIQWALCVVDSQSSRAWDAGQQQGSFLTTRGTSSNKRSATFWDPSNDVTSISLYLLIFQG